MGKEPELVGRYQLDISGGIFGNKLHFRGSTPPWEDEDEIYSLLKTLQTIEVSFPYLHIFDLNKVEDFEPIWVKEKVGGLAPGGMYSIVRPSEKELYILKIQSIIDKEARFKKVDTDRGSVYIVNKYGWEKYESILDVISSPSGGFGLARKYGVPIRGSISEIKQLAVSDKEKEITVYEVNRRGDIIAEMKIPLGRTVEEYIKDELGELAGKETWMKLIGGRDVIAVSQNVYTVIKGKDGRNFKRYVLVSYPYYLPDRVAVYY